jgi:uncharacterized membrane protein
MYLKSNLIKASQGVVVQEVVHLGVPAIDGVTIVPTHPHYLNRFKASVDPDAVILDPEGVASELITTVERGTADVQTYRDELNDRNKATKRQLDHLDQLADQDVSAAKDLRADADLVRDAKRDAADVARCQLDTTTPEYVAARAIAGRIDCDDLATVVTPGLRKAVEGFERGLAAVENAQGRARRQLEAFTEIERKMADPARGGAAQDLRRAMHVQQRVDQLAGQLDAVRSAARDQLAQLDALAGELAQLQGEPK